TKYTLSSLPTRKSPVMICPCSRASNASSLAPTGSKRKPTRPVASRSRALGTACASLSKMSWKRVLVSAVTVASSASISSLLQFSHWPRGGCFLSKYKRARLRSAGCSGNGRSGVREAAPGMPSARVGIKPHPHISTRLSTLSATRLRQRAVRYRCAVCPEVLPSACVMLVPLLYIVTKVDDAEATECTGAFWGRGRAMLLSHMSSAHKDTKRPVVLSAPRQYSDACIG